MMISLKRDLHTVIFPALLRRTKLKEVYRSSNLCHQGPFSVGFKIYKGSRFNVLVNWETGESTYKPLHIISVDDHMTCSMYAKDNHPVRRARLEVVQAYC